jgi:hypothetical protein
MKLARRLWMTLALALAAAGCATSPRLPATPGSGEGRHAEVAGAAIDLGSKFRIHDRETGRRSKAVMNAQYQLATEADEKGAPSAQQILRAHAQRAAIERETALRVRPKAAGLQPARWESIGPSNIGGRVRAIAFDPRNPRRILAGTASGGLWISEDGSATWRANHDFLPNLSVTTIAFDPARGAIAYLGTGEASAALVGVGAFKSSDGGETWQLLAATNADANPDWRFVNRIAVHPGQPAVVLAAVTHDNRRTGAIYRSSDGGTAWTRVSTFKALDIAFEPGNPDNVVAGLDDGTIGYSRDAGVTWTRSAPLIARPSGGADKDTARAEIAFARSERGVVYASVDNERGEVWRSNDSGATWTRLANPRHLAGQGDYDNAIWVDPLDANHVIVGGLDLYQSFDAGASFVRVSDWTLTPESPHADHHAIVSPPDYSAANPTLFNGNDGGIYRAANARAVTDVGVGWTNANNGLAVTQFYSGAGRASAGGKVIGGTQDNGSLVLNGGAWRTWRGADGGYVAVDPTSDQLLYGEIYYLAIFRSVNGGGFAQYICNGITEAYKPDSGNPACGPNTTQKANFIAPFILDPNNPNRLLGGAASLWVSDNVRAATPAWRAIKPPSPIADNNINAVAVHEGDGNAIWVGYNNGEVHRSPDALAATPTWTRVGQGVLPARRVNRITIDRDRPGRVIVSFTGFVAHNVWQTLDGGATWSSITGNLPNAPVFDVKRHPANPNWLYAATSVGVFTSESGGGTWSTTNEGPANIRVRELFWIDDATLGAATYGRGMFKVHVPAGGPANYQDLWWAGPQENGWGMSITQHGSVLFTALYIYDAQGQPQWAVLPSATWNAGFTAVSGELYVPTGSWFGAYDAARLAAGAPAGRATITFDSATTATLDYTLNGRSGRKSITRQGFGAPDTTPVATYGDLWWGGSAQNGWGVAINQQYRTLFSVWYTYDESGKTVWYVIPGGSWTAANTFSGTAYRVTGSPWAGAVYNPAAVSPQAVGTVTFTFKDINNAVMTYTIGNITQSKPLSRQPF